MTQIQQTDVINAFGQLLPGDLSVDAGQIDLSNVVATYPLKGEWLGLRSYKLITATLSLNGGVIAVDDTIAADYANSLEPGAPSLEHNRVYQGIRTTIWGGTVTPITVNVCWHIGVITLRLHGVNLANPGVHFFSNVFAPAGARMRVETATNGGAGDNIIVSALGVGAPSGVPLPALGAITGTTA